MFCMTLKHHSWESEVEVILSVIVSLWSPYAALNRGRHLCLAGRPSGWALAHILVYYVTYIDVGIEATACAHSANTIRYFLCTFLCTTYSHNWVSTMTCDLKRPDCQTRIWRLWFCLEFRKHYLGSLGVCFRKYAKDIDRSAPGSCCISWSLRNGLELLWMWLKKHLAT